jgi:hypothetical protein
VGGSHNGHQPAVLQAYAGPSRRQRRSSSRCPLRALHVDAAAAPALIDS